MHLRQLEKTARYFFQHQLNIISIRCHGAPKSPGPIGHGLLGLLGFTSDPSGVSIWGLAGGDGG